LLPLRLCGRNLLRRFNRSHDFDRGLAAQHSFTSDRTGHARAPARNLIGTAGLSGQVWGKATAI
jgi:hypothetical protein